MTTFYKPPENFGRLVFYPIYNFIYARGTAILLLFFAEVSTLEVCKPITNGQLALLGVSRCCIAKTS